MAQRNHGDRRQHETGHAAWIPVFGILAIMATGCLSTFMFLQADMLRPRVGDMVVFAPGQPESDVSDVEVEATEVVSRKQRSTTCVLEPDVMIVEGGSLVVEARDDAVPSMYRLHWAGSRTSRDPEDCGTSADLTVSRADLQKLANAAGGFGIGRKGVVW